MSRPDRGARRVYLDTSAYLCLLLNEPQAQRISNETTRAEVLSSVLLLLETRRNLVRFAREGSLSPEHYQICADRIDRDAGVFILRDLTLDLCQSTLVPAVMTPRSLDLAHLRTAWWFHAETPIDRFLTLDTTQAQAARELGLPV